MASQGVFEVEVLGEISQRVQQICGACVDLGCILRWDSVCQPPEVLRDLLQSQQVAQMTLVGAFWSVDATVGRIPSTAANDFFVEKVEDVVQDLEAAWHHGVNSRASQPPVEIGSSF
jgi:hypothetical protein